MTIHRAYGYVDRAAEGAALRVVMASEGKQADGIDLRMSGVDLARFNRNPVLGYGHAYWRREDIPIGRVDNVKVDGKQLVGDLMFDPDDEFAMTCERKIRGGFLSAVSIGFEVTEWENENDNYWRGGVATGWELSELSVVPVPMDANAVVTGGRSGAPTLFGDADLYEQVFRFLREHEPAMLAHYASLGLPAGDPPAPAPTPAKPAGVPTDAARILLAALKS